MRHFKPVRPVPTMEPAAVKSAAPPPIHWREKTVLLFLSVHLLFLPWAIGTMHVWSQQISLALASLAFLAAVILNPPALRVIPKRAAWKKIATSPAIWLGLVILGYILVQALNPAYKLIEFAGEVYMIPIDYKAWLPSGMGGRFEEMNEYRHLMIFGSAFLTLWTISMFVERRKSAIFLLWILAINGCILAAFTFVQFFGQADQIFWKVPSSNPHFYGSFIYKNHAAGYMNLVLAISIGLFFHFRQRSWRDERRSDKSPIFFFAAALLFTAVLFSNSRVGVTVAATMLLLAAMYTLIQAWRWERLRETSIVSAIFLGLLALVVSVFTAVIGPERIFDRFERLRADGGEVDIEFRIQAYQATADMIRDKPLYGWGAGGFRYAFPAYQMNYPDIQYVQERRRVLTTYALFWEFAHNDWLQYPAEYGIAGFSLFLIGLAGWMFALMRNRAFRQPVPVWLAIGILLTISHSFLDFVLQNPAIIITFAAAIAISGRLSYLESSRRFRRND